jgi:isoleucyl-tRNA synthetase
LISAPFTPFLSEHLYSHLSALQLNQSNTVFKESYPSDKQFIAEEDVERRMKRLQQVASIVRSLRSRPEKYIENGKEHLSRFFSVKVPLSRVIVAHSSDQFIEDVRLVSQLIQEEVNCLDFELRRTGSETNYKVYPNLKNMGKRFRGQSKEIQLLLEKLTQSELDEYYQTGKFLVKAGSQEFALDSVDAEVKIIPNEITGENLICESDKDLIVAIDTTYNETILNMHLVRLFITKVQALRKETDLHPWNPIVVYYQGLDELLTDNKKLLAERLLCRVEPYANRLHGDEFIDRNDFANNTISLMDKYDVRICIVRLD